MLTYKLVTKSMFHYPRRRISENSSTVGHRPTLSFAKQTDPAQSAFIGFPRP